MFDRRRQITLLWLVLFGIGLTGLPPAAAAASTGSGAAPLAEGHTATIEAAGSQAHHEVVAEPRDAVDSGAGAACSPKEAFVGQTVTCRVRVSGIDVDVPLEALRASVTQADGSTSESRRCRVQAGELVCSGLAVETPGEHPVALVANGFGVTIETGLSFTALAAEEQLVALDLGSAAPAQVVAGRPIAIEVVDSRPEPSLARRSGSGPSAEGVFGLVRRAGGDQIVERVVIRPPGSATADRFSYRGSEPGLYRLSLCLGDTAETCDEQPGSYEFEVVSTELVELIPGHNVEGADRIDLVVMGSGFAGEEDLVRAARAMLGFDGKPSLLDISGRRIDRPTDAEVAFIGFGPFAIEPLRSNRHRFNLWFVPDQVEDVTVTGPVLRDSDDPVVRRLGLDHAAFILLSARPSGDWVRASADWPAFSRVTGAPEKDGAEFGFVYMHPVADLPEFESTTLAHELGHALFDLRDEYVENELAPPYFGYPNCASSVSEGLAWWGDLVGDIDPFYFEWREAVEEAGLWEVYGVPAELLRVGTHASGCYSMDEQAVRPTANSLMNGQVPVFGSVNRRAVEEILGLWSGTRPLGVADLAADFAEISELTCNQSEVLVGDLVQCSGELPPFADVPAGDTFMMRIGEGRRSRCILDQAPDWSEDQRRGFTCRRIDAGIQAGTAPVRASLDGTTYVETGLAMQVGPLPRPTVRITNVRRADGGTFVVTLRPIEMARRPFLTVGLALDGRLPNRTEVDLVGPATSVEIEATSRATQVCAEVLDENGGAVPLSGSCRDLPPRPFPTGAATAAAAFLSGVAVVVAAWWRRHRRAFAA